MGYDQERFIDEIADELKCAICLDVLEVPIQLSTCHHVFCQACILQWMNKCEKAPTCPQDRRKIGSKSQLKAACSKIRSQLSQLRVKCNYASRGCRDIAKLSSIKEHEKECEFNPQLSWFRRRSISLAKEAAQKIKQKELNQFKYVYLGPMPSLYSYSYCTLVHRF